MIDYWTWAPAEARNTTSIYSSSSPSSSDSEPDGSSLSLGPELEALGSPAERPDFLLMTLRWFASDIFMNSFVAQ